MACISVCLHLASLSGSQYNLVITNFPAKTQLPNKVSFWGSARTWLWEGYIPLKPAQLMTGTLAGSPWLIVGGKNFNFWRWKISKPKIPSQHGRGHLTPLNNVHSKTEKPPRHLKGIKKWIWTAKKIAQREGNFIFSLRQSRCPSCLELLGQDCQGLYQYYTLSLSLQANRKIGKRPLVFFLLPNPSRTGGNQEGRPWGKKKIPLLSSLPARTTLRSVVQDGEQSETEKTCVLLGTGTFWW